MPRRLTVCDRVLKLKIGASRRLQKASAAKLPASGRITHAPMLDTRIISPIPSPNHLLTPISRLALRGRVPRSPPGSRLPEWRVGKHVEACLGLLGKAGEYHRDVIAGVPAPRARDDDSRAMHPAAVPGRLQGQRHLRPLGEGCGAAELDAILVDNHRVR